MIARPLAVLASAAALTVALAGCSRTGDSAAPPASSRAASVTADAPVSPGAPVAPVAPVGPVGPVGPSATASATVTPSTTVTIDLSGINAAVSQANKDVSAGDSARAQPDGS